MTENQRPDVLPALVPPREPYFQGEPRELNNEWKELVRETIAANRKLRKQRPSDPSITKWTHPRSHTELADAIERHVGKPLDPSSISRMLGRGKVSGIADATSEVLRIPKPTEIQSDRLSGTSAHGAPDSTGPDSTGESFEDIVSQLSDEQRQTALRLMRELMPPGDRDRALRVIRALLDEQH